MRTLNVCNLVVLQEKTDRVCLEEIAQLLTATEPAIRMMACVALSRVVLRNPYRALQQLIENDPSQHVGKYAADAIQEMLNSCSAERISAWLKYEDEAHTQISTAKMILSKRFGQSVPGDHARTDGGPQSAARPGRGGKGIAKGRTWRNLMRLSEYVFDFSFRTEDRLKDAGISTLRKLLSKHEEDLLRIRNFGRRSLAEVKEKLACVGPRPSS